MMSKDYEYIGNRHVNVKDPTAECGERMWYDRDIDTTPTECVICIEAENERFTAYAHPRAHVETHTEAGARAETMAMKEKVTEEYIDYYTFYYGREYRKIYRELYKKYREEYYATLLEKTYGQDDRLCQHHLESIQYHAELNRGEQPYNPTYEICDRALIALAERVYASAAFTGGTNAVTVNAYMGADAKGPNAELFALEREP